MRRITTTAAAIMTVALLVPGLGRAEVIQPDCMYDPVNGDGASLQLAVGATCTADFEITEADAASHVSVVGTHGGYHGYPASGAYGTVGLQWKDANGAVVAEWSCRTFAGNADYTPQDATSALCSTVKAPPASLPVGTHTLVTTALEIGRIDPRACTPPAVTNCGPRLHGRLLIRNDIPV